MLWHSELRHIHPLLVKGEQCEFLVCIDPLYVLYVYMYIHCVCACIVYISITVLYNIAFLQNQP